MNSNRFEQSAAVLSLRSVASQGAISGLVLSQTFAWQEVVNKGFEALFDSKIESFALLFLRAVFVSSLSAFFAFLIIKFCK